MWHRRYSERILVITLSLVWIMPLANARTTLVSHVLFLDFCTNRQIGGRAHSSLMLHTGDMVMSPRFGIVVSLQFIRMLERKSQLWPPMTHHTR